MWRLCALSRGFTPASRSKLKKDRYIRIISRISKISGKVIKKYQKIQKNFDKPNWSFCRNRDKNRGKCKVLMNPPGVSHFELAVPLAWFCINFLMRLSEEISYVAFKQRF
jgi:hypothetical protein